jgi:hypothetical protein
MRFIAHGPDFPDELLWAQDEGRVNRAGNPGGCLVGVMQR